MFFFIELIKLFESGENNGNEKGCNLQPQASIQIY